MFTLKAQTKGALEQTAKTIANGQLAPTFWSTFRPGTDYYEVILYTLKT